MPVTFDPTWADPTSSWWAKIIQRIPSVGPVLAAVFIAEIGEPGRSRP